MSNKTQDIIRFKKRCDFDVEIDFEVSMDGESVAIRFDWNTGKVLKWEEHIYSRDAGGLYEESSHEEDQGPDSEESRKRFEAEQRSDGRCRHVSRTTQQ
jgi:hypothetical protein